MRARVQTGVGVGLILVVIGFGLFGGWLTPHGVNDQSLLDSLDPPFDWRDAYIFGTDQLGRDVFARMASGARVTLAIAACVVVISGIVGVLIGAVSGYLGGRWDAVIQKAVETVWAFPPILLAIIIVSLFGQTLPNLIIALAVQRWIPYARLARAEALALRGKDFITASKIMGGTLPWILRKHVIPNLLPTALIVATFSMATAILAEASLSFLGLGVPSDIPSWGSMLADGRSYVSRASWLVYFPGLGIFLTVLGLNLLGDGLRERMRGESDMNVL